MTGDRRYLYIFFQSRTEIQYFVTKLEIAITLPNLHGQGTYLKNKLKNDNTFLTKLSLQYIEGTRPTDKQLRIRTDFLQKQKTRKF